MSNTLIVYYSHSGHFGTALTGKIHGNSKKSNDHNCQQDITKGGRDISCFAPVIHYNIVKHKKILLRLREEEPHRIYIQRKQIYQTDNQLNNQPN